MTSGATEDKQLQGVNPCPDLLTKGNARRTENGNDLNSRHRRAPIANSMIDELEVWAGNHLAMATISNFPTMMLHRRDGTIDGIGVVTPRVATRTTWKRASMRDPFTETITTRIIRLSATTQGVENQKEIAEESGLNVCPLPRESCHQWDFRSSGKSVGDPATITTTMTLCTGMSMGTMEICCPRIDLSPFGYASFW